MSNPNKYGEIAKEQLLTLGVVSAIGAVGTAAFKLDQRLGSRDVFEVEQSDPEIISYERPDADKALVLMGGLCMGIRGVAKRYASQLDDNTNLFAPVSPDAGFNPAALFEKTYEKVEASNPSELIMAGLSMGGKLGMHWLDYGWRTGRQDLLQDIPVSLVFQGSPMDRRAIRLKPRMLLNTVGTLGYSYALERSRPILQRLDVKSAASAPKTRAVPECKYLLEDYVTSLSFKPRRVVWILGTQSDPVINERRSIMTLQKGLGVPIEQITDKDRLTKKHMPTDKRAVHFVLSRMGIAKSSQENTPTSSLWDKHKGLRAHVQIAS